MIAAHRAEAGERVERLRRRQAGDGARAIGERARGVRELLLGDLRGARPQVGGARDVALGLDELGLLFGVVLEVCLGGEEGLPAIGVLRLRVGGELAATAAREAVRERDAHAWAEVWVDGNGWVRVDPTSAVAPGRIGAFERLSAPQGVVAAAFGAVNPTLAANLRAVWEAVNNGWNQWVLNYTQSKQLDLLKNIGFTSPSWEDLSYVLLALIVLASAAGAGWTLWDRHRQDPWLRLLRRAQQRLQKAGATLPANAPPRQTAAAARAAFGDAAQGVADWLLRLEARRYAPRPQASLAKLQQEYKHIAWPQ